MTEYHKKPLGGHQGSKRISNILIWTGMKQYVIEYLKKCNQCQTNKHSSKYKMPIQITTTAKKPFERIALHVVGPLPDTIEGNRYFMTFQYDLTKLKDYLRNYIKEKDDWDEFIEYAVFTLSMSKNEATSYSTT